MTRTTFAARFSGVLALAFFSNLASAQSTISGQVRDSSGAVMAGVAVVASSPARRCAGNGCVFLVSKKAAPCRGVGKAEGFGGRGADTDEI